MSIASSRIDTLKHILDVATLRHQVIAQNIANINTPFYQRLEVEESTETGSPAAQPSVVVAEGGESRADGNNVHIEQEMNDLSNNTLLYNTAIQILTLRLASSRAAIAGR